MARKKKDEIAVEESQAEATTETGGETVETAEAQAAEVVAEAKPKKPKKAKIEEAKAEISHWFSGEELFDYQTAAEHFTQTKSNNKSK